MKRWSYSLVMLVLYVALFLFWKQYPSRTSFVAGGAVVATVLAIGMYLAAKRGYFVNRVDLMLHAYVILDVVLEAVAYEGLKLGMRFGTEGQTLVGSFHNNNNFYGCAAAFALLIGTYRFVAVRKLASTDNTAQPSDTGEAKPLQGVAGT